MSIKKYQTDEDLQQAINDYLESNKENPTITGLALHLGFESRQSFYDYEKNKEHSYTIKRARLHIENFYEKHLIGQYTSGPIFALKNFGWSDKQEIEHAGKITSEYSIIGIDADKNIEEN